MFVANEIDPTQSYTIDTLVWDWKPGNVIAWLAKLFKAQAALAPPADVSPAGVTMTISMSTDVADEVYIISWHLSGKERRFRVQAVPSSDPPRGVPSVGGTVVDNGTGI